MSDHGLSDLRHLPVSTRRGHLLDHLQPCFRTTWRRRADGRHRPEGHHRHCFRYHPGGGAEREEPDWENVAEKGKVMEKELIVCKPSGRPFHFGNDLSPREVEYFIRQLTQEFAKLKR